jgi:chorismate synthase
MTNGEVLRVRAAMKPISTVPRALATLDVSTGEQAVAIHQRSDVCAVPAAGVVAEAMVALVVADAVTEKFGGDSVSEVRRNVAGYLATLGATLPLAAQPTYAADAVSGADVPFAVTDAR